MRGGRTTSHLKRREVQGLLLFLHLGFKKRQAGLNLLEGALCLLSKTLDLSIESLLPLFLELLAECAALLPDEGLCDWLPFHTASGSLATPHLPVCGLPSPGVL